MSETGENGPTEEEIAEAYKINDQINRGELKPGDVDQVDRSENISINPEDKKEIDEYFGKLEEVIQSATAILQDERLEKFRQNIENMKNRLSETKESFEQ